MRYRQRMMPGDLVSSAAGNLPFAEGGSVSHLGPYRIHVFSQDDWNNTAMYQSRNGDTTVSNYVTSMTVHVGGLMDILVVGGGGGGACMGGGGGGGGFRYFANETVTAGTKVVQVGGGGGSEFGHNETQQRPGGPSFFGSLVSEGGGAGVSYSYNPPGSPIWLQTPSGSPFGSGGGGSGGSQGSATPAGAGTAGQGHPGGTGHGSPDHGGGGGGGAGQAGHPNNLSITNNQWWPGPNSGNGSSRKTNLYPESAPTGKRSAFPLDQAGGNGLANDISGFSTHYAGGGGGGAHPGYANHRTMGGLGGGGEGTNHATANHNTSDSLYNAGQPGGRNLGGGGGGGTHSSHQNSDSGRGGPGIVIVRYKAR